MSRSSARKKPRVEEVFPLVCIILFAAAVIAIVVLLSSYAIA
jgi:hypothetical protein